MKVLIVTTVSQSIGFLIPHIRLLIDQGHEVEVAFNIVREVHGELIELGCKIHNIEFQRSPLKKENYIAFKKIKKLVIEGNFDLLHTHTPIASFLTRLACRDISNLKVLYTAHGFHFFNGAPFKNWLIYYTVERIVARWTDVIITMNEEDYEHSKKLKIRKSGSLHKVHGVGIDLKKFKPTTPKVKKELRGEYGYSDESFILFYAAELNYNKHQDLLIDVMKILKDKIPNIKLLLAGTGNLDEIYRERVNKLGLNLNVEFLGLRRDVHKLLSLSDVAVASSRREGLPVNVMEAMATGLPLLVTDVRGQRDLVNHGENGYLVGVDDVDNFAKGIEELYKDDELREEFSKRGIELVQKYSLENVLKEIQEIYLLQLGGK